MSFFNTLTSIMFLARALENVKKLFFLSLSRISPLLGVRHLTLQTVTYAFLKPDSPKPLMVTLTTRRLVPGGGVLKREDRADRVVPPRRPPTDPAASSSSEPAPQPTGHYQLKPETKAQQRAEKTPTRPAGETNWRAF